MMSEQVPMLVLSADRARVLDEHGAVKYERREVDGRPVYVAAGMPDSQVFCASTGLKMACTKPDGSGGCDAWETIDVSDQEGGSDAALPGVPV